MRELRFIDIPKAREEIQKEIVESERLFALHTRVREFFESQQGKMMNVAIKTKLLTALQSKAPELGVTAVWYYPKKVHMAYRESEITIKWRGAPDRCYTLAQDENREYDLDRLSWSPRNDENLAHLRTVLPNIEQHATAYNAALLALCDAARVASVPGGIFSAYPLSDMFSWYELSNTIRQVDAKAAAK